MTLKSGWKTYAACAALIAAGVASAFGVHVPEWALTLIAGAGGIAGRMAIANNAKAAAVAAEALAASVAEAVNSPEKPTA